MLQRVQRAEPPLWAASGRRGHGPCWRGPRCWWRSSCRSGRPSRSSGATRRPSWNLRFSRSRPEGRPWVGGRGYPTLLAVTFAFGGDLRTVVRLQQAAWAVLILALAATAQTATRNAAGLVPIVLVATYPGLLLFRHVLTADLLFAVFLNLAMAGLLVATCVGRTARCCAVAAAVLCAALAACLKSQGMLVPIAAVLVGACVAPARHARAPCRDRPVRRGGPGPPRRRFPVRGFLLRPGVHCVPPQDTVLQSPEHRTCKRCSATRDRVGGRRPRRRHDGTACRRLRRGAGSLARARVLRRRVPLRRADR